MPEHDLDLTALRARFVSPPGPCPVCGAARAQAFEPEDSAEYWHCPNVDLRTPGVHESLLHDLDLSPDELGRRMAGYCEATRAWVGSPQYDAMLRHKIASDLTITPDADVVAVIDRLAALEAAIRP